MGFKCPMCLKDFGNSKDSWKKHVTTEHRGLGLEVVKVVEKTVEKTVESIQIVGESEDE